MSQPNDEDEQSLEVLAHAARFSLPADTRILLVDDDPIFSTLAASVLGLEADQIVLAKDGAEAMHFLDVAEFHLAIVDLSMPEVDGFRLIAHIRHTPRLRRLPIVVVTSRQDLQAIEEVHAMDVQLYMTKPLNLNLFPFSIHNVLRVSRKLESIRQGVLGLL
ncbi:MAG: hypothetical protein RLZ98_171 [Pseudomonadota bacterium]|jgi:CheY-like chemotaxis protein